MEPMSELYGVERLPLPRAAEMTEIDRRAREEHGVPERLLMESAGRAIAQVVQQFFPEGKVVAAVGSGHNGGDAFIAELFLRDAECLGAVPVDGNRAFIHLHGVKDATLVLYVIPGIRIDNIGGGDKPRVVGSFVASRRNEQLHD